MLTRINRIWLAAMKKHFFAQQHVGPDGLFSNGILDPYGNPGLALRSIPGLHGHWVFDGMQNRSTHREDEGAHP